MLGAGSGGSLLAAPFLFEVKALLPLLLKAFPVVRQLLFALGQLAAEYQDTDAADALIDRYHFLREFVDGHAEAGPIFRAID